MKITTEHLRFYQAKKTPVPGWITQIAKTPWSLVQVCAVSVHDLINVQTKRDKRLEAHNLMHLVRLVQSHKQETVYQMLYRIGTRPSGTDSKRRVAYAKKWALRLLQHRMAHP